MRYVIVLLAVLAVLALTACGTSQRMSEEAYMEVVITQADRLADEYSSNLHAANQIRDPADKLERLLQGQENISERAGRIADRLDSIDPPRRFSSAHDNMIELMRDVQEDPTAPELEEKMFDVMIEILELE